MSKSDEATRNLKAYLAREHSVVEDNPIPKDSQEKPSVKKETPKNDDFNDYDYSDSPDEDDSNW